MKEKAKSYKAFQNDISDLEKKGFEYEGTVSKLTKELKHAGFDDKLTHEKIVADAEALAGKKVRHSAASFCCGKDVFWLL